MRKLTPELFAAMTPLELARLDRLLQQSARAAWAPLPGPQSDAFSSQADILLYGGAAGGGKTDLLLGVAKSEHRKAVIFRRVFPSLTAIIERSREMYEGREARYNASAHRWRLDGARLVRFGSMQFDENAKDWQGQAHDLYGFDEITEFTEYQFRYVIGWNRSTHPGQRCRVICTGNPPTDAAGEWVIKFWGPWLDENHPHPAKPGELRWFTTRGGEDVEVPNGDPVWVDDPKLKGGGEWVTPKSRTFIPAKVQDNPYLVASGYVGQLQALPEPLRSKMLYGDFRAGREDDAYQVIPSEWVRLAMERWKARPRPTTPMTALGVDVARGGEDRTALAPRYDNWFDHLVMRPGSATPDGPICAAFVVQHWKDNAAINADVIGVGGSVVDQLRQQPGVRSYVHAINVAERSEARDKSKKLGFVNKRAEFYWKFREALDPESGENIALPPDPELKADLCAPTWSLQSNGIKLEPKDDLRERIKRSPDKGDAVILAHANVRSGLDRLRALAK